MCYNGLCNGQMNETERDNEISVQLYQTVQVADLKGHGDQAQRHHRGADDPLRDGAPSG